VKCSGGVDHGIGELRRQQLRPSDAVLVEAGGLLESGVLSRGTAVWPGKALWIQNTDRLLEFVPHHPNWRDQIRIPGDDNGAFVEAPNPIQQQVRGKVYIGTLFLGLENFNEIWGRRNHRRHDFSCAKVAFDDGQIWQRGERSPEHLLSYGLAGVVGQCADFGGEILCSDNLIAWERAPDHCHWIKPAKGGAFECAVKEIEPINVEECFYTCLLEFEISGDENAGAVSEETAPRPAVETDKRDVGLK
jgi:hypothetical protein